MNLFAYIPELPNRLAIQTDVEISASPILQPDPRANWEVAPLISMTDTIKGHVLVHTYFQGHIDSDMQLIRLQRVATYAAEAWIRKNRKQ